MRQALFGGSGASTSVNPPPEMKANRRVSRSRLRVTLRVGNEYEGKMFDFVHDADTLSTLLAEQEATKAARKKYRFVELVSVRQV
ncbi:hypothetical protein SAMN05444352_10425 [Pseudomonas japonica]|uniref:Uncharacterized protein n=2 Tax=Pseudomonas japonica TaxID=256466 RepID=A0A239C7R1_9PSED|nr:hypothetical protein SAMN05444352_10425 [Pseudomonas japonica]